MTQEERDRFGLQGDPEIQKARRLQLGGLPLPAWVGAVFAVVLALSSAVLLLSAHHWPGWVGGALGILAAFLGFLAWRKASVPLFGFGYGAWLLVSFIAATQGQKLEARLNAAPLRTVDLILPVIWILLLGIFVWQAVKQSRRS